MLKNRDIYNQICARKGQVAVLIDPEKTKDAFSLDQLIERATFAGIDYFFVGGSTVTREEFTSAVTYLKEHSSIPVVLFPGAAHQLSKEADALLYLSLLSGRNPDYLIGHHVMSAQEVFDMDVEVIPTAYLLIDGGTKSSVAYVSQTTPIPIDKESIIVNTAKAGILQGKKLVYVDAGSGALHSAPAKVIERVSQLHTPVIVGGGIRSIETLSALTEAGANVLVIGNKLEEDIDFLLDIRTFLQDRAL